MSLVGKLNQVREDIPEFDDNINLKLKWFVIGYLFVNGLHLIINIIIK